MEKTQNTGEPRRLYSMRLGVRERQVIAAAAAESDTPLSTYIRERALEAARRDLAAPDDDQAAAEAADTFAAPSIREAALEAARRELANKPDDAD